LLVDRILVFNALDMQFRTVAVKRNHSCPICGEHPEITGLGTYTLPACDLK
jgi:molybdopterin/thiamine biosynthesis adenylyltransferase